MRTHYLNLANNMLLKYINLNAANYKQQARNDSDIEGTPCSLRLQVSKPIYQTVGNVFDVNGFIATVNSHKVCCPGLVTSCPVIVTS